MRATEARRIQKHHPNTASPETTAGKNSTEPNKRMFYPTAHLQPRSSQSRTSAAVEPINKGG